MWVKYKEHVQNKLKSILTNKKRALKFLDLKFYGKLVVHLAVILGSVCNLFNTLKNKLF